MSAISLFAAGLVFWMAQACAVIAETAIVSFFQRRAKGKNRQQGDRGSEMTLAGAGSLWWSIAGRLWVAAWLLGTGWWVLKGGAMIGVWEWALVPTSSLTRPFLQWLGVPYL
jgi:hypothetical protein